MALNVPDSRPTVLYVEDEDFLRTAMGRVLTTLGFNFCGEEDSHLALEAFRKSNPRIVLLDGNLEDGPNGLEVLKTLVDAGVVATRQQIMETGCIPAGQSAALFYSGGMQEEDATEALIAAIVKGELLGALPKPTKIDDLKLIFSGLTQDKIGPSILRFILETSRRSLETAFRATPPQLHEIDSLIASLMRS